jgi:glyoxylase-like metal-dependent hydrolase (beta-lactamase superfamily II)
LVRRWPDLEVYVHERGAPHLIDPEKLLTSAARLYGDEMERLWGEVLPVPEENLTILAGGEEVSGFEVLYTPGHASHHVAYMHGDSGRAFVGDAAAVRIPPSDFVATPTPPPDIDLEAWNESLDAIASWGPKSLGLTHFAEIDDPSPHLERVRHRLAEVAERARNMSQEEFEQAFRDDIAAASDEAGVKATIQTVPPDQQYLGLERYWRKREERQSS